MKPRLLILSDLFGGKNPEWINFYIERLNSEFNIQYYDLLELSNFDGSDFDETNLHHHFLNGGIETAIQNLLKHETEEVIVLGFSIGGTIGWKAALKGLDVECLVAVSSTRLRLETEIPNCGIKLFFGVEDQNKPNSKWFSDLKIDVEILPNESHLFYLNEWNSFLICNKFYKKILPKI